MENAIYCYYFFETFLATFFGATFFATFFTAFFGATFFAVFFGATFLTAFLVVAIRVVMRVLVNKFRPQDLLDVKEQIVLRRFLLTSIITCKKN